MKSNIVHQYFKKEQEGNVIYIQVDPIQLKGHQLTIDKEGGKELEELEFDHGALESLPAIGFRTANALEFHILLNNLR